LSIVLDILLPVHPFILVATPTAAAIFNAHSALLSQAS
jgi:hypothetical protein